MRFTTYILALTLATLTTAQFDAEASSILTRLGLPVPTDLAQYSSEVASLTANPAALSSVRAGLSSIIEDMASRSSLATVNTAQVDAEASDILTRLGLPVPSDFAQWSSEVASLTANPAALSSARAGFSSITEEMASRSSLTVSFLTAHPESVTSFLDTLPSAQRASASSKIAKLTGGAGFTDNARVTGGARFTGGAGDDTDNASNAILVPWFGLAAGGALAAAVAAAALLL